MDGLLSALKPDGFVSDGLRRYLRRLEARTSKKPKRPAVPAVARLKALYGRSSPELERLDRVLREGCFTDTPGFFEWTPEVWGPVLEPAKGKNLAEELIAYGQEKWPPLLEELFGGGVALGWTRSGDLWLYGLYDSSAGPERHAVHLWSHGTARVRATVATDLDTFALAQVLCDLINEGAITAKAATQVAGQLVGRVCMTWPFDRVIEKLLEGKARPCPAGHHTPAFVDRAAWIKTALLGEPPASVRLEFEPERNPPMDDADFKKKLANATTLPPTAFYLLFRSFFFGHDARLAEAIVACGKSPVPVVKDAARLLEQIRGGRKALGQIEDVHALKKAILDLRLDPDAGAPASKAPPKKKAKK